jgi:hypothetical protein
MNTTLARQISLLIIGTGIVLTDKTVIQTASADKRLHQLR